MSDFTLHPQLVSDCDIVGELPLSLVLLMNDANYPWVILVPKRHNIREMYQLSEGDRAQLMKEISTASEVIQKLFKADKMNVGALGNMVPQLHVHIIARHENDAAWPNPVWGAVPRIEYVDEERLDLIGKIKEALAC
ncbi:HIT domain-containing protein [Kordiimonas sp. SCSIO 12610]|uniref:HIT family protein n=1 Tax=Kordiimonas sp. SCSIO 12610 TaxID=2829597 RepID=UPI00210C47E2|nr:HIT family protein [Kordiimonas sp. SCSIO 12610]UTW55560.1 HIT family protein [Kordiimonas sp. SCSIO 12610]